MPTIDPSKILDYVTLAGGVVLALTPIAHALNKAARGLQGLAFLTATTADDKAAARIVKVCDALAKGADALVRILPRVTFGRISEQAAADAVKP